MGYVFKETAYEVLLRQRRILRKDLLNVYADISVVVPSCFNQGPEEGTNRSHSVLYSLCDDTAVGNDDRSDVCSGGVGLHRKQHHDCGGRALHSCSLLVSGQDGSTDFALEYIRVRCTAICNANNPLHYIGCFCLLSVPQLAPRDESSIFHGSKPAAIKGAIS